MPMVVPFISGFVSGFAGAFGVTTGTVAVGTGAGAISAAAAGVTVGGWAATAVISIGLSAVATKMLAPSMGSMASMLDTSLSGTPAKRFVYGETRVAGQVVLLTTTKAYKGTPGAYTSGDGENDLLHMVLEVAGHEIESFSNPLTDCEVYIKDEKLTLAAIPGSAYKTYLWPGTSTTDTNGKTRYIVTNSNYCKDNQPRRTRIMLKFYDGTQTTADQDLIDASGFGSDSWTSNHIGKGRAYVYARISYDPAIFSGFPEFTFKIKGKSDVYDPRGGGSTGYTDNPALVLADYMTTTREAGGLGATWDEIDETALTAAANTCEETVTILDDATTQDRYVLGGAFLSSQDPNSIMGEISATMAGWYEKINGKWQINAGEYTAQAMTLTESEMRDRPAVSLNKPSKDIYNEVKPILRATETEWQPGIADNVRALTKFVVSPDHTTETFTAAGHGLSDGDRVQIRSWNGSYNDANIPTGITANVFYYLVNTTTNTFQLSLTKGGSAVAFTSNGTNTILALYDNYLSKDTERKTADISFSLVNNQVQAKRLALISLLSDRQEITATLQCKMGTADACPFDSKVGDSVRWIDQHKLFWETTGAEKSILIQSNGNIVSIGHGLETGDPIIFNSSASVAGFKPDIPYYVNKIDADNFTAADYRGGPAIDSIFGSNVIAGCTQIQGKLFRVVGWKFVIGSGGVIGVNIDLRETADNIYTWQNGYELAPETQSGITAHNPWVVETLDGLTVESGTDQLYLKSDGTVISRVKLSWNATTDTLVKQSGRVDIEYRLRSRIAFTTTFGTDTFNVTGHGLSVDDELQFFTTGTLPAGLSTSTEYYVISVPTADTFKVSEYPGGPSVTLTSNGTGTHTYELEDKWQTAGSWEGSATQAYLMDVQDGAEYDFRARFRNSMNANGFWDTVTGHTVVGKTAAPAAPTGLSASTTYRNRVEITWTDPTDTDLSHIEVWRDDGDAGAFTLIATVLGGNEKYIDFTAEGLQFAGDLSIPSYLYKLKSVDTTNNKSSFTSTATGYIDPPSGPASASGSGGVVNCTATWSDSGEFATVHAFLKNSADVTEADRVVPAADETITLAATGTGSGYYFRLYYVIHGRSVGTEYSVRSDTNTFTVTGGGS